VLRKYLDQSDHDGSIGHEADGPDVDLDIEDPELSGGDWDIDSFNEEMESKPMKDQVPRNLIYGSSDCE
jgi:hypothetical protein